LAHDLLNLKIYERELQMLGKMITIQELEFLYRTVVRAKNELGSEFFNGEYDAEIIEDLETADNLLHALLITKHDEVTGDDIPEK